MENNKKRYNKNKYKWARDNIDKVKEANMKYRKKNSDKVKKWEKGWKKRNRKKISDDYKKYREKNRIELNRKRLLRDRKRLKTDFRFYIISRLRKNLIKAVKKYTQTGK